MEEYTIGFPPDMNKKNHRKHVDEKEDFLILPLEGELSKENQEER